MGGDGCARDFTLCCVVRTVKDMGGGRREEGASILLALGVATSDCHGKVMIRVEEQCDDKTGI